MPKARLPHNEEDRLAALRTLDVLDTAPEEIFDRITRVAANYLDVPICLVSLVDAERQWFKSRHGLDAEETHRDLAFCAHAILRDEPLVVNDARDDDRFSDNPLVTGETDFQFYAGIPLELSADIHIGTLCVLDHKPRELSEQQLAFLTDLAGVVVDQFKLRQALADVQEAGIQREIDLLSIQDQALRTDTILNTVVDGIITIDHTGLVQSFNPGATKIFGYPADEVIGKNVSLLMPTPYMDRHDGYISAYLTSGKAKIIGRGRELTGLRKDGSTFPMELAISEMVISGNTMFTGIVRDITEKHQILFQMESARAMAQKANQAKSDFLSSMSHELRTPLNSVMGFSQILMTDTVAPMSTDQQESAKHIYDAGRHLLELINKVLDLSRIEAGKFDINPVALGLKDLLQACVELMEPQAVKAGLTMELQNFEDLSVLADPTPLKQIVLNLLSNAVKYNQAEGRITVSVDSVAAEHVAVSVVDTGMGIPDDRMGELFQPFNRLDVDKSGIEGTGVGLVITQQLVELMGGSLDVASEVGEGSTFTFRLPLARP